MLKTVIITFMAVIVCAGPGIGGTISGTVHGADGTAIGAGLVSASRQPGTGARSPLRTSATVIIQRDGGFQLPPFAGGVYQVCVQAPGTAWLNSCEWGQKGTVVALTASEPSARISIALSKGALVTVRVNDPAQLLPAHEGKSLGAHFLLGLSNDADLFRPAALVSQDAAGRTYQILAPFDRTIHIAAASGFFQLADAVGRPLPSFGTRIPVLVSSGQPAAALLLSVAGLTSSAAAR